MRKYRVDIKGIIARYANWKHPDFGTVAKFFGDGELWEVDEEFIFTVPFGKQSKKLLEQSRKK